MEIRIGNVAREIGNSVGARSGIRLVELFGMVVADSHLSQYLLVPEFCYVVQCRYLLSCAVGLCLSRRKMFLRSKVGSETVRFGKCKK